MFLCVALFGVMTIVFGLSRSFLLSLVALALLGAADMVSVVVRQTLVQINTPDAERGRVSAVNSIFIGASNQLGEFESGRDRRLARCRARRRCRAAWAPSSSCSLPGLRFFPDLAQGRSVANGIDDGTAGTRIQCRWSERPARLNARSVSVTVACNPGSERSFHRSVTDPSPAPLTSPPSHRSPTTFGQEFSP